jgi:hypothetical protein
LRSARRCNDAVRVEAEVVIGIHHLKGRSFYLLSQEERY